MARAKPSEDRPAKEKAKSTGLVRKVLFQAGHLLVPLTGIAAVLTTLSAALWWPMAADAQAVLTRERLLSPMLLCKPRPAWITEGEIARMAQLGLVAEGRSVFEPGLAERLAAAYQSSPWVESVGAVRVRYPAGISVERIALRMPFARLESEQGAVVVDRKGFILPLPAGDLLQPRTPACGVPALELPAVTGFRSKLGERAARIISAEALEALELLDGAGALLSRAPGSPRILCAHREPAGGWSIMTAQGLTIEWGCWRDDRRPPNEPSFQEKKEWLMRRLTEWDARQLQTIKLYAVNAPVAPRSRP